jgi:hypothetical protein
MLIGLVAALALFSGLAQSAYAHGRHSSNRADKTFRIRKKSDKYMNNYLAPKKQHRVKDFYRSPVTGNILPGKAKR